MEMEYLKIIFGLKEPSKQILIEKDLHRDFIEFIKENTLPKYRDKDFETDTLLFQEYRENTIECESKLKALRNESINKGVKVSEEWGDENYIRTLAKGIAYSKLIERVEQNYNFLEAYVNWLVEENSPRFSKLEEKEKEKTKRVLQNMMFWLTSNVYASFPEHRKSWNYNI